MNRYFLRDNRFFLIAFLLALFMATAFLVRMVPAFFSGGSGPLYIYDTDTWYTLRQIGVMVNQFPQYNWFDPMTAFPSGKAVDWGPLYPFLAASLCLLAGAASQDTVISTAGFVSPALAALMVPVVYLLGKKIGDWKTGIISAGLVAIVSNHYVYLSLYGLIDHHMTETLFCTVFVLLYISALIQDRNGGPKKERTWASPAPPALSAGIVFSCALLASPTAILMAGVVGLFTLVQCCIDHRAGRSSGDLLVINGLALGVSAFLLILSGFHADGLSITRYSPGLVYILFAVIAETAILVALSRVLRGKTSWFVLSLAIIGIAGSAAFVLYPPISFPLHYATVLFSGSTGFSAGVVETHALTLPRAGEFFGLSVVLAAVGLLVLVYQLRKEPLAGGIFLIVWSLAMFLLTVRYWRFDYYSTIPIVLLSAIGVTEPFRWRDNTHVGRKIHAYLLRIVRNPAAVSGPEGDSLQKNDLPRPGKKTAFRRPDPRQMARVPAHLCLALVVILAAVTAGSALYKDLDLGLNVTDYELSQDWLESLGWLGNNTPETGVEYLGNYPESGYSYPGSAYGIMASWESGHWITFFSHRIPITNPFQDNLAGPAGAAAFFLSQDESQANEILANLGGRYVIVDSDLAVDTFTNLPVWPNNSVDNAPYITEFILRDPTGSGYDWIDRFNDGYFRTIVARLYNFDGSLTLPKNADYIRYGIREVSSGYQREISRYKRIDISAGTLDIPLIPEGSPPPASSNAAGLFSRSPTEPVAIVSALKHYRLVHESPSNATVAPFPESVPVTLPGIKKVKIFEFVAGARIAGEGIIEVEVVTNTGRTFTYRQESGNGGFIVPYATTGSPYGVTTAGPYHIVGTDRYFAVTDRDIVEGNLVRESGAGGMAILR